MYGQMLLMDSMHSLSRGLLVSSERISSGFELNSAKDNPSGVGELSLIDVKLREQRKFSDAINEAHSYLGTQEVALNALYDIATRMLALKTSADQAVALGQDIRVFEKEYISLQNEFIGVTNEKFNGSPMFTSSSSNETYEFSLPAGERAFDITKYSIDAFMQGDTFRVREATYKKIRQALSWDDAKKNAESLGGHLAVFTTQKEYNEIQNVLNKEWGGWIGIEKPVGGSWISVTGEELDYLPWAFPSWTGMDNQHNAAIIREDGLNGDWETRNILNSYILELEKISLADVSSSDIEANLQNITLAIAQNGSELNKLTRIQKNTESNTLNLERISARIEDVDYPAEAVKKMKQEILMDRSVALLSQANIRSQTTLRLLYAKIDQEWEFASKANKDEQRDSKALPFEQASVSRNDEDSLRV